MNNWNIKEGIFFGYFKKIHMISVPFLIPCLYFWRQTWDYRAPWCAVRVCKLLKRARHERMCLGRDRAQNNKPSFNVSFIYSARPWENPSAHCVWQILTALLFPTSLPYDSSIEYHSADRGIARRSLVNSSSVLATSVSMISDVRRAWDCCALIGRVEWVAFSQLGCTILWHANSVRVLGNF